MTLIPWKSKSRGTALAEWAPGAMIGRFRSEMDRLVDRFFEEPWAAAEETLPRWAPSMDISETDKEISIRAEIPGVDLADIEVTVSNNILTICGQKKEYSEQEGENFYHCERSFGTFHRSIELPTGADADKVIAEERNGVLTVRIPKLASARGRRIPVNAGQRKAALPCQSLGILPRD